MSLIYISGPYSTGDHLENVNKAIDVADQIAMARHDCYIPHLNHYWGERHEHPYDFWMKQDIAVLVKCDALVRLPGISHGADIEWNEAAKLGIPVFVWTKSLPIHLDGFIDFWNRK